MSSPGINHNRNVSMEFDNKAPGASAKKKVISKNLSKFIKPYNRTDKPTNGTGAIVVGTSGGVRVNHNIGSTNPDETDTDTELRVKSSMVV